MPVLNIKDEDFDTVIKENEVVLIDFYADWCGPCKMIAPVLEELGEEGHVIAKLNVDSEPVNAEKFEVMSIPTLIVFKNGEKVSRHEGYAAKAQIEELLK